MFNIILEVSATAIRKDKEIKCIKIEKEKKKKLCKQTIRNNPIYNYITKNNTPRNKIITMV